MAVWNNIVQTLEATVNVTVGGQGDCRTARFGRPLCFWHTRVTVW